MIRPALDETTSVDPCSHGEPRGARYCALCRRAGITAGEARRDEAIGRVEVHADAAWKRHVMKVIHGLATERSRFTTDDVWARLDPDHGTHEPRAMGAMMRQAAKAGIITPTDAYEQSARPECHARPVRVWESVIAS